MEKAIKIYNREIPVEFFNATVIHTNKYAEASGGMFNLPVRSTLYTEVVFRLTEFDRDCRVCTRNLDLPVYTSQEVSVISTNEGIIGFIDSKTNHYYYTVSDFARKLGMGLAWYWFLLAGWLMAAVIYFIQGQQLTPYSLLPLLVVILLFYVQKWRLNYLIRRSLDQYLQ